MIRPVVILAFLLVFFTPGSAYSAKLPTCNGDDLSICVGDLLLQQLSYTMDNKKSFTASLYGTLFLLDHPTLLSDVAEMPLHTQQKVEQFRIAALAIQAIRYNNPSAGVFWSRKLADDDAKIWLLEQRTIAGFFDGDIEAAEDSLNQLFNQFKPSYLRALKAKLIYQIKNKQWVKATRLADFLYTHDKTIKSEITRLISISMMFVMTGHADKGIEFFNEKSKAFPQYDILDQITLLNVVAKACTKQDYIDVESISPLSFFQADAAFRMSACLHRQGNLKLAKEVYDKGIVILYTDDDYFSTRQRANLLLNFYLMLNWHSA